MSKKYILNHRERQLWVDNDEGLYNLWRTSGMSRSKWIRENQEWLDAIILRYLGYRK